MSRITNIQVRNAHGKEGDGLKNQMFSETLEGVTLFAGPNGAGKTTRIFAVLAALDGLATVETDNQRVYLGDLPRDTEVVVSLDSGDELIRDLSLTNREKAFKETDGKAAKMLGKSQVSWDLQSFSKATSSARGKVLDAIARAGGELEEWDANRAQQEVRNLLVMREQPTIQLSRVVQALPRARSGSDWLQAALVWAKKEQQAKNADQRTTEAHVTELGKVKVKPIPGSHGQDEQELSALSERSYGLMRSLEAKSEALESHSQLGASLKDSLTHQKVEGQRLAREEPKPEFDLAYLETSIEDAKRDLEAPIEGIDIGSMDAEIELRKKAVDELSSGSAESADSLAEQIKKAGETQQIADALVRDIRNQIFKAETQALYIASQCVHCSKANPLGLIAPAEFYVALEEARQARDTATSDRDRILLSLQEAQRREDKLKDAHGLLAYAEARKEEAIKGRSGAFKKAEERLRQARVSAENALKAWEEREASRKERLSRARAEYLATLEKLKAWETTPAPDLGDVDPDAISKLEAEAAIIKARIAQRQEQKALINSIKSAVNRADEAKEAWKEVKQLSAAISDAIDALAAAAHKPINDAAQALMADDKLPTPFFHNADRYGAIVGGIEVPYHALGGAEKVITTAAVVFALSAVSRQPCKIVMLDELNVVQNSHRMALLRALVSAQRRGAVDTVICTMQTEQAEIPEMGIDGLQVVMLEKSERSRVSYREIEPTIEPPIMSEPEKVVRQDDCPF